MGLTTNPNGSKKRKNRMKGPGITEAMSWGKVYYYGVSIPQGVTARRGDDEGKLKTTERGKKEIT